MAAARCANPGNFIPNESISTSRTRNPVNGTIATCGIDGPVIK